MVGCCEQRAPPGQNKNNGQPGASGRGGGCGGVGGGGGGTGGGGSGGVQGKHNEKVCHCTGERRKELLGQIKEYLGEFDEKPCLVEPKPRSQAGELKPLSQYPEYMRRHCQSYMPDPPQPPITGIGVHEVRYTENYEKASKENSEYLSYRDARVKPPPPSCDCAKRNGLQDQCPRPECSPPTPECLANNPGPCCPPSLGLTKRDVDQGRKACHTTEYTAKYQGQQPEGDRYGRPDAAVASRSPQQRPDCCGRQNGATAPASASQRPDCCGRQNGATAPAPASQRQDCCGRPNGATTSASKTQKPDCNGRPDAATTSASPPQGRQIVCFCRATPTTMPSGQKYLCCPLPES